MCDSCDWPIWVVQCEELRETRFGREAMMVCRDIELYEHVTRTQVRYLQRLDRQATLDRQRRKKRRPARS